MRYRRLIVAIATLLFSSRLCAQNTGVEFVLPTIPQHLTTATDRADYLALHYWDSVDMSNADFIRSQTVEQAFVDYLSIFDHTSDSSSAFTALWSRSYPHRDTFYHLLSLMERYLYDVASPMRNEELYIAALEAIEQLQTIESIDSLAATSQLGMLKRNRIGAIATDFSFEDKSGAHHNLSEYKAEYILLLFASADCDDCKRMKSDIDSQTRLWMMLRNGRLAIISITLTTDKSLWQQSTSPARWIEGWDYNQTIASGSLYDLNTTPRLYLLDSSHRVLLKNTTPAQVEQYISNR